MPRILLTQQFVDNPPIVQHKTKTDYFDTVLGKNSKPGFSLKS